MIYFIVNYTGGGGNARKTWNFVRDCLKQKGIDYKAYQTEGAGHASVLADKISRLPGKDKRMVVVGGDGTLNEVLNGINDFSGIKLGLIPTGSGNDFARGLGLALDTEEALDNILSSVGSETIDLGRVITETGEERVFGISCGIGLDAIVCKRALTSVQKKMLNKIHLGNLTYKLLTVETLIAMKKYNVKVRLYDHDPETGQDTTHELDYNDMIFLAGMNLRAEGGGVPMCPDASFTDGKLSICAVNGISKVRSFGMLLKIIKGEHQGKKGINIYTASKLELSADVPMVLHADGEYVGDVRYIVMETLPQKLGILGL